MTFFSYVCIGVFVCAGVPQHGWWNQNTHHAQDLATKPSSGWVTWILFQVQSFCRVCTILSLAHILLRRISEQTWLTGPLTWYGDWTFVTESCCRCCTLLWLLKYFPTIWFLDRFILRKWYSLDNFDFTTCK